MPDFLNFMLTMNTDLKVPVYSDMPNTDVSDYAYTIKYNSIPLSNSDETYTYIQGNGTINDSTYRSKNVLEKDTHIVGIKSNTNAIKLVDKNGKNITNLINTDSIHEQVINNKYYPIIVNEYAAKKYGIKVGDKIGFDITNNADRFDFSKIEKKQSTNKHVVFTVVGVNATYVGEEYYTSQDVANYVVGLKSHINDEGKDYNQPKSNYYDTCQAITGRQMPGTLPENLPALSYGKNIGNDTFDPSSSLYDLSNPNTSVSHLKEDTKYSATPYGFNGVFTDDKNGSNVVKNGLSLYSPSGI
jgi:putative ABC transport system permease protein